MRTSSPSLLTDVSPSMVETTTSLQPVDGQTQFGNSRRLDPSDSIFVFKNTLSDYEEPPSDEEVSPSIPNLRGVRFSRHFRSRNVCPTFDLAVPFNTYFDILHRSLSIPLTPGSSLGSGYVGSVCALREKNTSLGEKIERRNYKSMDT